MNPREYQKFVAAALAAPAENMEKVLSELTRSRDKAKRQEEDNFRYKAMFKAILKPTPEFIKGLEQCKSYKQLDMYSYTVLKATKGSLK